MRKLIFLLTAICLCSVIPIKASDILHQADSAYTADNFQEAAAAYQHVIKEEGTSAEIFTTLETAITGWENWAKLFSHTKEHYASTQPLTMPATIWNSSTPRLQIGPRTRYIHGNALDSVANSAKSNTWSWLAFAFFVITLTGVVAYIFSSQVAVRKTGFFWRYRCFHSLSLFHFSGFQISLYSYGW